jgi:two-component sensor histidine kinase
MKIDVQRESGIAREIGQHEVSLGAIKENLELYKESLRKSWDADETIHMTHAMELIQTRIGRVASSLRAIESDIISTANTIRQEEDAKEAAEIAAREAALKQIKDSLHTK